MAAKLAELRKQAKDLGIAPALIRACDTPEELQSVITGFGGGNDADAPAKPRKKAHGKVAKAKGKKGNSTSASSKSAPAATKSAKSGKAKRPTAAKAKKQNTGTDGPTGRNLLNGVDFSSTDGWNPREGSPPDRIVKALKRYKGNRGKVFDALVGEIWEFVGKKKADGSKRNKADAESMLRYRISRTAFDFAVRTGQHETSDNRATYGEGGTGQGIFKRKGKGNSAKASKSASKSKSTPAKAKAGKASKSTSTKASKPVARKGGKGKKATSKK